MSKKPDSTKSKKPTTKKAAKSKPKPAELGAKSEPVAEATKAAKQPAEVDVPAEPKPAEQEPKPAEQEPKPKSEVAGPDGGFGVPSDEVLLKNGERGCRIKNLRNKAVVITLEHEVYCNAIGRCVCSTRAVIRERRIEKGSKAQAPRKEMLRIPKSINLSPLGVTEPLHEAAKLCADVWPKVQNRPQKLKILPI